MAERKIRHVGDVFGKPQQADDSSVGQPGFKNMFKNKKAPQPPSALGLKKIGSYQPKILMEPKSPDRPLPQVPNWDRNSANLNDNGRNHAAADIRQSFENKDKQFIMGDKNVPITIGNSDDVVDDSPIAPPRRKRSAPSLPSANPRRSVTENPMFGRSLSQRSDEERFSMNFEEQGGDIDFGYGIDNPAFVKRRAESSSSVSNSDYVQRPERSRSEPFIPPPDYDDEEVTMNFEDEFGSFDGNRNFGRYRELEGEDFARYLRDDEDLFPDKPQHWRSQPNIRGKADQLKKTKPKGKQAKLDKKKKQNKDSDQKRNTIRDFTFSDSKIGWGDRTVKSTSAKGRYIKREKGRQRVVDQSGNFQRRSSEAQDSYEDFLRHKNPLLDDHSPNSSDSGVELVDDRRIPGHGGRYMNKHTDARADRPTNRYTDVYLNSQPKQMRSQDQNRKPGVWKRLTWRFRKSVEVTKL